MIDKDDLMQPTVRITTAYLTKNAVQPSQLPSVIKDIHLALSNVGRTSPETAGAAPEPAVPIKRSVRKDSVTCLECGRAMAMLKRHLRVDHELTVPEYKAKWRLPAGYPVVAPEYAERRSEMAKRIGLGKVQGKKRARKNAPVQDTPAA